MKITRCRMLLDLGFVIDEFDADNDKKVNEMKKKFCQKIKKFIKDNKINDHICVEEYYNA